MKHRISTIIPAATLIIIALFCQVSCTVRARASGGKQALFEKASEDLDKESSAAKAEGLPQSDKELFGPAPKPADNAALVYASSVAEMGKHWRSYVTLQRLKGPPGSKPWKDAATSLPLVVSALDKAQAAASLPHCWTGTDANFATKAKQLAKALCAKARLQVSRGQAAEAMVTLQAVWKIGEHAAMEPTLSGFINSVGIKRMVC